MNFGSRSGDFGTRNGLNLGGGLKFEPNPAQSTYVLTTLCPPCPPVASNDAYSTAEDTTLVVAAPGVLGNDSDVNGDALTASVAVGPPSGSLTLNADGSFTYIPVLNFNGAASFTYRGVPIPGSVSV